MSTRSGWLYCGILLLSFVSASASAQTSVKKGVYSAAQAKSGREVYVLECQRCHAETLLGGGEQESPPLIGRPFLERWEQGTLDTLFGRLKETMPPEAPGKLTDDEYVNVLAYLLQRNRFPAGAKPLSADIGALNQIVIDP